MLMAITPSFGSQVNLARGAPYWHYVDMSDPVPKLRLRGVRKQFGDKVVLDGIDLDVMPRTSLVVIGGSGSGKSVLLKCILGLLEPDSGSIEIDGRDLLAMPRAEREAARAQIGMLFQNGALFDSLPVWENVAFGLLARHKITRAEAPSHAASFLAQVGLAETVGYLQPAELSGGMQKRVALARAIAAQPNILSFDEPTTGLDPIMSDVINELILQTRRQSPITSVVVTHDLKTVFKVADRVVMFYPLARLNPYKPQILYDGSPKGLQTSPDPRVRQFVEGKAGERLAEVRE
jgi:phospholipid/cholesterol/gamma-HCH transport system ATP-binding protein